MLIFRDQACPASQLSCSFISAVKCTRSAFSARMDHARPGALQFSVSEAHCWMSAFMMLTGSYSSNKSPVIGVVWQLFPPDVFAQRHLWMGLALCHCWRYTLNECFEKKPCIFLASASEVYLLMHALPGNVIGARECYFCLRTEVKYKLVIFAPFPNPWIFGISESNPVPNAVFEITSQLNIKL